MSMFSDPTPPAAIQQPPPVLPPPTMPDPQSPDVMAARQRAQQSVMSRAGRSSTILSSAMNRGDSTGASATGVSGGSYGSTKLGGGS